MLSILYVVFFVGSLWVGLVYSHYVKHGVINNLQVALSLFCVINLMICLWEIALFFYIERIKSRFEAMKKKLPKGTIGTIFLFKPVSFVSALTLEYWSDIWSTYSLFDPSYSDTRSFGWNVDIGNGFSTLIPTILFAVGMTDHTLLDPRVLGMIGLASFWQELYGTIVYFTQYIVNRQWRHHDNSLLQIVTLVGGSNGTWIMFPALGIYASYHMIMSNSYSIFLTN